MFRKLGEGDIFVTKTARSTSGPRTAVLSDGRLLCTFMVNSRGGANDFTPMTSRSEDGINWSEARELWPGRKGRCSDFVSVRRGGDGLLYLAGKSWEIAGPGESFWCDAEGAMKENRLIWSVSPDGQCFPEPTEVPLPYPGAAENPGGMFAGADGVLRMVYSPYPVISAPGAADTNCMVLLTSHDGGGTFLPRQFARIAGPCLYAETWIERLSDGRLFVSSWQTAGGYPTVYFLSDDEGETFKGPFPQPFRGQSTSVTAGPDGTVYVVYNQRKEEPAGVWLALEKPGTDGAVLLENQVVWEAAAATAHGNTDFSGWTDFSFGEPCVTVLGDGTLLVTLWYQDNGAAGIRYVRLSQEV